MLKNRKTAIVWKTATVAFGGKISLQNLSAEQILRKPAYLMALRVAESSRVPNPKFSNYFVRGSLNGMACGNIEYGLCQALHCEESGAPLPKVFCSPGDNPVLAFYSPRLESADNLDFLLGPCGNCRDILLDVFGEKLEVVSGSPNGGLAVVVPFSFYLFDDYKQLGLGRLWWLDETLSLDGLLTRAAATFAEGRRLEHDAFSPPDIHPERKYYAMVETANGGVYYGAFDLQCEYHPIYPLRDATRQARRSHDSDILRVVIVRRDSARQVPHVMYKDRQHLLGTVVEEQLLSGKEVNPPVLLVAHNGGKGSAGELVIADVWKTSARQWLPSPFTETAFGADFVKAETEYLKRRRAAVAAAK